MFYMYNTHLSKMTVTEVVRHFAEVVDRIYYRNESLILTKGKKDVVLMQAVGSGGGKACTLQDLATLLNRINSLLDDKEHKAFASDLVKSKKHLKNKASPWDM